MGRVLMAMLKISDSFTKLTFLCFGVGAVGTYVGGSLALTGHKVVFLDKPAVVSQIKTRGLRLHLTDGSYHYSNPDIVSTIEEALTHGPFDLGIVAVRSGDTQSLLKSLKPYIIALPPVLCLQNGVENEALLYDAFGGDRVIAGVITSDVKCCAPGEISLEQRRGLGIASGHFLAPTVTTLLNESGMKTRLYDNTYSLKWSKLLGSLMFYASTLILGMPLAEMIARADLCKLEAAQLSEALNVMRAQDIPVYNLPKMPAKTISVIIRSIPNICNPIIAKTLGIKHLISLSHAGNGLGDNESEAPFINGAVVRYGKQYRVSTPVNNFMLDLITQISTGEISKDEYFQQPEKLVAAIRKNNIN